MFVNVDNCINNCNGHGTCDTISDLSLLYGPPYNSAASHSGDGIGPTYLNWDANSIQACLCDLGYSGPDCSLSKILFDFDVLISCECSYRIMSKG